mgnify:CR=1 FL=1
MPLEMYYLSTEEISAQLANKTNVHDVGDILLQVDANFHG